jgi:hypothetical protein
MNVACWAVPIRDGYVLCADRSAARILQSATQRSPQFWGFRINVLQPQSQLFSAPLAERAALMAVNYARLTGVDAQPKLDDGRWFLRWMGFILGLAFIVASGGHWIPALAGVWLLVGRYWTRSLFGLDAVPSGVPLVLEQQAIVTSDAHAELARIEKCMLPIKGEAAAYSFGESQARSAGLDEVADVYAALASGLNPSRLPSHIGFWVACDTMHDPSRLALPAPDDSQIGDVRTRGFNYSDVRQ